MIVPQDEENKVQEDADEELLLAWDLPTTGQKVVIMIPKRGERAEDEESEDQSE